MASFALHAWGQAIESQPFAVNRTRCVAPETLDAVIARHQKASSLNQILGHCVLRTQCEIKSFERLIVADAALIKFAVVFVDVSLTRETKPESPANRNRNGLDTIGNRVDAHVPLALEPVRIRTASKAQNRMRLEDFALRWQLHRVCHRRNRMRLRLCGVASSAFAYRAVGN